MDIQPTFSVLILITLSGFWMLSKLGLLPPIMPLFWISTNTQPSVTTSLYFFNTIEKIWLSFSERSALTMTPSSASFQDFFFYLSCFAFHSINLIYISVCMGCALKCKLNFESDLWAFITGNFACERQNGSVFFTQLSWPFFLRLNTTNRNSLCIYVESGNKYEGYVQKWLYLQIDLQCHKASLWQ